jgi:hypothetical protein
VRVDVLAAEGRQAGEKVLFESEDRMKLVELVEKYGDNWTLIAEGMGHKFTEKQLVI